MVHRLHVPGYPGTRGSLIDYTVHLHYTVQYSTDLLASVHICSGTDRLPPLPATCYVGSGSSRPRFLSSRRSRRARSAACSWSPARPPAASRALRSGGAPSPEIIEKPRVYDESRPDLTSVSIAEADGATREEHVLGAREERLELGLAAADEAGDEEQDRGFVEMLREVEGGRHVPLEVIREVLLLGALDRG